MASHKHLYFLSSRKMNQRKLVVPSGHLQSHLITLKENRKDSPTLKGSVEGEPIEYHSSNRSMNQIYVPWLHEFCERCGKKTSSSQLGAVPLINLRPRLTLQSRRCSSLWLCRVLKHWVGVLCTVLDPLPVRFNYLAGCGEIIPTKTHRAGFGKWSIHFSHNVRQT